MKNVRVAELDILRAIAALAVITIHVTAWFVDIPATVPHVNTMQRVLAYIDHLNWFAVPTFLFISGLVLYNNHPHVTKDNLWDFYKKRIRRIFPIYFLFSLFYMVIAQLPHLMKGEGIQMGIGDFFLQLALGGASYHLWYFGLLFQFYLFYPVLVHLYNRYKGKFIVAAFVIQLLWIYTGDVLMGRIGDGGFFMPLCLSHLFWFTGGFLFLDYKDKILSFPYLRPWTLLLLILALNAIRMYPVYTGMLEFNYYKIPRSYFYFTDLIDPFYTTAEILFVYKLAVYILNRQNVVTHFFSRIGYYSLEIYLIHAWFLVELEILFKKIPLTFHEWLFYPVMWITAFLISYLFAVVYKRVARWVLKPFQQKKNPTLSVQ
ncbi:acyltransferase [Chitinophaga nivalis]|uniref:Acyltransferase n=1 Tax=Chitinophaga nivalis TaxID=2991709 RepID=A0ABT3IJM6_9BACT|nr:acyltransferase [Chitinophaga nivalis]MCW3466355.1 acyltransferase [Chitinophaga nivalis]MCW3483954.1 acyltransferase [Chitinophaga nivalis]